MPQCDFFILSWLRAPCLESQLPGISPIQGLNHLEQEIEPIYYHPLWRSLTETSLLASPRDGFFGEAFNCTRGHDFHTRRQVMATPGLSCERMPDMDLFFFCLMLPSKRPQTIGGTVTPHIRLGQSVPHLLLRRPVDP
jgi:hypothetical protein